MTASTDGPPLVIVGASVRGVATSAARAGFRVFAADLFGDHDLRAVAAAVTTIQPYPDGIPGAVAAYPPGPLIYTGALENHPALIARLAAERPLACAGADAVMTVRDAWHLAGATRDAGISFPDTRHDPANVPRDGTWLVKPIASGGGRGIRSWFGELHGDRPCLWQRRISGQRLAVGYLLHGDECRVIATSRQLVGCRWCRARPFHYCGSIDFDPTMLDGTVALQVKALGALLARRFGLAGLVGADFVVDPSGRAWVIEVNPRPTASMELAERATGDSLVAAHMAAFAIAAPLSPPTHRRSGVWAKAILFARCDVAFASSSLDALLATAEPWTREDGWPAVADIPEPPSHLPTGVPVCTVFAHGASPKAALGSLRSRVGMIETAMLGG
jgi:predicted ATP-grasp superfamily ATP-dependent carboligase